ncbi:hypothetical protein [Rivularia sp. UHCC 0363]|uniref:hypothetical protein n=1 Tax=Rivularia sp. UHCC 0363 TaxID=3110244 RepID=UPI002B217D99|nr:hypothetical protein [Rivularia sp. UHCC 0363]MEA5594103.1 hypothetical protein [Rivularia sp. UHCC 0363]
MNLRNKTLASVAFAGLTIVGLSTGIPTQAQTTQEKPTILVQKTQMNPEQMHQQHREMMGEVTTPTVNRF